MNRIDFWKESASESFAQNGKKAVEDCEFAFEVSNEQKEYLEEHLEEVDGWCNEHFGVVPHTIHFEKFWNGVEECYTCEVCWD